MGIIVIVREKSMAYRALIPVKSLRAAKSRLAMFIPDEQREQLVLDMLQHVVNVLQQSEHFECISVVSADARVLAQASQWGARPLFEERHGHNPALQAAALREQRQGVRALLTLSADLPFLQADDIDAMIEASEHYEVVLAPSREGTGTNALLVRPPLAVPYVFGVNSLQHYLTEARLHHLHSTLCTSHGLAWDIDTPSDLTDYDYHQDSAIRQVLPSR